MGAPRGVHRIRPLVRNRFHIISRTRDPPTVIHFMKRRTEKPSNHPMQFFTPELYLRFNSADDRVADLANEEWEAAIDTYNAHLAANRGKMPHRVADLAKLSLHDAELIARDESTESESSLAAQRLASDGPPLANGVLSLRREKEVLTLIYVLWDHVRDYASPRDWPFSKLHKHWLYDEIDVAAEGRFLHRILLSDGSAIEVPFVSIMIHSIPYPVADSSRKIA
jgi:hypothetical protein